MAGEEAGSRTDVRDRLARLQADGLDDLVPVEVDLPTLSLEHVHEPVGTRLLREEVLVDAGPHALGLSEEWGGQKPQSEREAGSEPCHRCTRQASSSFSPWVSPMLPRSRLIRLLDPETRQRSRRSTDTWHLYV